jgi:imidazole glycerol-phosphate synthase subunit HisF
MRRVRIIPVLLMHKNGLVKSEQFSNYKYVGDPINAVKIFNEKEVDEIAVLDISATKEKRPPNIEHLREIASEAFMPLSYGGGITKIEQVNEILGNGAEKVIIGKAAFSNPELITEAAMRFGSQSIVVSIDVKKNWLGRYKIYLENATKVIADDLLSYTKKMEELGAGEILLNSIDKDGTFKGYDLELIEKVSSHVSIPVIASGGASYIDDFLKAIKVGKASAVAAGSFFVFQRPHKAVLISYPSNKELQEQVYSKL